MMFSECLEYGKYDLQYLQGTVRVQNPVQFRGFSEYYCEVDRFRRYAFRGFLCVCVATFKNIFLQEKKLFEFFFFDDCGRATLPRFKI